MALRIIRNDITKVKADIIVNSANPMPVCGGSTEASIYEAAGYSELLNARLQVGEIAVGNVAVTNAFALQAKYIIHTVGPVWNDGASGELELLASCYRNALSKATELKVNSIAFPLISSGVYKFPKDLALQVATNVFEEFLKTNDLDITLVVYDEQSFVISESLFKDVEDFLNENYEEPVLLQRMCVSSKPHSSKRSDLQNASINAALLHAEEKLQTEIFGHCVESKDINELLNLKEDTFQERLYKFIKEKNIAEVDVYKRANMDRKHFSKIRSNTDYQPKRATAFALAIALQLDLAETTDLISRAGIAFSPASKFDMIIYYFIINRNYNIWKINNVLFMYGEPQLGS